MFDLTHGFIFAIGSMTLIISILVIFNYLVNTFKKEKEELNEAQKSIQRLNNKGNKYIMKLNAKQKDLLKLLVKGKGKFQTPVIPKENSEKNLDNIVSLYLKGLLTFEKKHDIDLVGPSNEHMIRFSWYLITLDKSKTLKDIRSVIKAGKVA